MQIGTFSSSAASEHSAISESSPTLSDQPRAVLLPALTIQVGSSTIAETPSRQLCSSGGRGCKVLELACALRTPRAIREAAAPCISCNPMHRSCNPMHPGCNPMHPGCNPMHPGCNPMHPGHTSRSTRSRFCGATDCSTACILKQNGSTWDA
eukprot:scaffold24667_cov58-Phaeocystis_antarctica.AAC.3